jgi:YMGG-like Gly-zipper
MKKTGYLMAVLLAATCVPAVHADDNANTAAGAVIGGVAGAVIGNEVGGKKGALIGAAVGGVTGAVIGSGKHPPLPPRPPLPGEVVVPVPLQPGVVHTQARREDEREGEHRRHHDRGGHRYAERERHDERGYRHEERERRHDRED